MKVWVPCLVPDAQELLRKSATNLRLETRVSEVHGNPKNGYALYGADREKLGTFDAVVIAAPLVSADITLDIRKEVKWWLRRSAERARWSWASRGFSPARPGSCRAGIDVQELDARSEGISHPVDRPHHG